MNISRIQASAQLATFGKTVRPESNGSIALGGVESKNIFDKDLYVAYARNIKFYTMGEIANIHVPSAECTESLSYTAAIAQQEQATAVGTVTTNGTIVISVTSDALTSYPSNTKDVTITTTGLPVAADWAAQARTALSNDAAISSLFIISGTGANIILTRKIDDVGLANDSTLNIAIAAGTAVGITNAPTSTNLTLGSVAEGVLFDEYTEVDAEGIALPAMGSYTAGFQIKGIRGSVAVEDDSSQFKCQIAASNFLVHSNNTADFDTGLYNDIDFTSLTAPSEITVLIVTKKA